MHVYTHMHICMLKHTPCIATYMLHTCRESSAVICPAVTPTGNMYMYRSCQLSVCSLPSVNLSDSGHLWEEGCDGGGG